VRLQVTLAQQKLDALARQLQGLEQDVLDAKEKAEAQGKNLSDATPLRKIQGALQLLKAETRQMRLREAMVRQQSFCRLGAPLPGGAGGAAAAATFVGTGFPEDDCSD
jgi:hypothetical protein